MSKALSHLFNDCVNLANRPYTLFLWHFESFHLKPVFWYSFLRAVRSFFMPKQLSLFAEGKSGSQLGLTRLLWCDVGQVLIVGLCARREIVFAAS